MTIASSLDSGCGLSSNVYRMSAMALVSSTKLQNPPEVEIWYV